MPAHYPEDRLYHRDALWLLRQEGDEALVGINHFAQQSLGEVVFLDLPRVGAVIRRIPLSGPSNPTRPCPT